MSNTTYPNVRAADTPEPPAPRTEQAAEDEKEKGRHPQTENELSTTQDKNPVPPDATRH
jgi:hypothetical protein